MPHENISRCTHAASIIHDRHVPIFLLNLEISIRLLHPNLGSLASTTSLPLLAAPRFRVITFETPCAFFKASPQTLPKTALRGRTMNRSGQDKANSTSLACHPFLYRSCTSRAEPITNTIVRRLIIVLPQVDEYSIYLYGPRTRASRAGRAYSPPPSPNEPNRTQPGVCLPSTSCEILRHPARIPDGRAWRLIPAADRPFSVITTARSSEHAFAESISQGTSRHTAGTGIIIIIIIIITTTANCRNLCDRQNRCFITRLPDPLLCRPGGPDLAGAVFSFPIVSKNSNVTRLE